MDTVQIDLPASGVGPAFAEVKRQVIVHYLERAHGNVSRAADMAGLAAVTVFRIIRELNLTGILEEIRADNPDRKIEAQRVNRIRRAERHLHALITGGA